jgi:hypothetical protein
MHDTLIVALSPEDIAECGTVENAINWQMEPFWMRGPNGDLRPSGSDNLTTWDWWAVWGLLADDMARRDAIEERYRNLHANNFLQDRRWHARHVVRRATAGEYPLETEDEFKATLVIHEDDCQWYELFWDRFIRNLPGDTMLVAVNYHF